jgi:nitrogen fixation/metabolism regulation signal transduction histidine kinase
LYERVQLSCPLNEEEIQEPVADSQSSLNRNIAVDKPPRSKEPIVNIMNTELINRAIEEAKSIGKERDVTASSTVAESEPSLSERRQVVRLLREIELTEVPQQTSSPLAWLRSYLGL